MGITSGRENLEDALVDGQEGDIEGTATKIVDNDLALIRLVETIGNCCGSRLVDNSEDVESGNDAGILGRLALVVLQICQLRNRYGCHGWDLTLK